LTAISVPVLPASTGSAYKRFKTHERPTATIAAVLSLANGEIVDSRIVAGSVGNRPERLPGTEALLRGARPSNELWQSARSIAMDEVTVEAEGFESVDYKRHLIGVLAARALQEAARRAV
jgi:CO/xanthine dehydrogenase FAD-binding subunit